MDLLDRSNTDEYFVTALHIFDDCGADNSGSLRVDALMDKFAPFVKTNKAEYAILRSLLDPDRSNPEINVAELAGALNKYSESQKTKLDLEESFNLSNKSEHAPHDSDSGISDGYQLIEELQCELREKAHAAATLRSQLEYTDRQHEEAVATLTAERDSLRAHLNMLRDENMTLTHVRRDYEESCERLCCSEAALDDVRRELDGFKRRARVTHEQLSTLENDKLTLQELLNKSKDECHRINEMYASRQSALLEQNESLKTECADLSSRLQDQEEVMAQIVKEKVLIEMELKDMLNKSNAQLRMLDRSLDISYTEDQMLSALDSLNADSRFVQENPFDEESFINRSPLKEDYGRFTNISLFDEIRLSCSGNAAKHNLTNFSMRESVCDKCSEGAETQDITTTATQTDKNDSHSNNNNTDIPCDDCATKCTECEKAKEHCKQLEIDLKQSRRNIKQMETDLARYDDNLDMLQNCVDEGNASNKLLQSVVDKLNAKLVVLEAAWESQSLKLNKLSCETNIAQSQTESDVASISTQADAPCEECERRSPLSPANKSWKGIIWDPIKSFFSIFAGTCLLAALIVLYNVSNYHFAARRCVREAPAVPWRWISIHDLLDFVFRIEYVGEVPM